MKKGFLLALLLGLVTTSQSFAEVTVAVNGSYDFDSINLVSHRSKLSGWSADGYQILGIVSGAKTVIQGVYANQSSSVVNHCLAIAEQISVNGRSGGPLLRLQVIADPTKKGFSLIQFCELYSN